MSVKVGGKSPSHSLNQLTYHMTRLQKDPQVTAYSYRINICYQRENMESLMHKQLYLAWIHV